MGHRFSKKIAGTWAADAAGVAAGGRGSDGDMPRVAVIPERSVHLADLLARTALADQAAFGELYRATSSQLYSVALRIVRDSATADEILQDCFIAIWHHAASYAVAKSQPLTWLTAIVRNRCIDHLRHRAIDLVSNTADNDEHEDFDPPGDGRTPVDLLIAGAEAQSVRDCLDALDGGSKQAIALAFFHGMSHGELAAHFEKPLGTVKAWVRRGMNRLRRCLAQAGVVP